LIFDFDFESTPSESYIKSAAESGRSIDKINLYDAVGLVEAAESAFASGGGYNAFSDYGVESSAGLNIRESSVTAINGLTRFARGQANRLEPIWFSEPDPAYSGIVAEKLTYDRGRILRRLLSETSVYADVCIILTGHTVFSSLNMRCFQNSHYIICPGRADAAQIQSFNNSAMLAERFKGVPANRFKYVIWDYQHIDDRTEAIWNLADDSLAGLVRKSRRRDGARRGGAYGKCYALAMEGAVKRDYDEIIEALGIAEE
jgi:hypothetical protein